MKVYLYVLNTLADWEIGYLTAELYSKRFFARDVSGCPLIKVGASLAPVTTMGGMTVKPDSTIDSVVIQKDDMLVLPGGDTWQDPEHDTVLQLAKKRIAADQPVAAICGATIALAQIGALNEKPHTSNDGDYLKQIAPLYTGAGFYVHEPAVSDRNLITASGQAPLLFAYQILKVLRVFYPETLEAWKKLYQTNEPRFFYQMMESLQRK